MIKKILLTIIVIISIILAALVFDFGRKEEPATNKNYFEDDNKTDISTSTPNSNQILAKVISNIVDDQVVSNPIEIEGKALGSWFFEGSFPIDLVDSYDNLIGTAIATADGEWMTTDYVNFKATLNYTKSTSTNSALIIFIKDNPSGDYSLDESIYIPVKLK